MLTPVTLPCSVTISQSETCARADHVPCDHPPSPGFFFFFWLHWVFVAAHSFSLLAASGVYSSLRCAGFSLQPHLAFKNALPKPFGEIKAF